MEQKASITALMSAFGRAYHAENAKDPIFFDSMAKELMTQAEYSMIASYILSGMDFFAPEMKGTFPDDRAALEYLVNTQIAPTPLARAAFCEELLGRSDCCQYVILGAAMDTFAFREPEYLSRCEVFEVDHPLTQEDKKARIARAGWTPPQGLHFVPMDFTKDDLCRQLLSCGFDPAKKTFFSWLGVSMYLEKTAIEATLRSLAKLSASGSLLAFDYADEGLLTSDVKRVKNMLAMAQAGGEAMKPGFDKEELTALLDRCGFELCEHLSRDDIQARYFADRSDALSAFEHISYACAERI